MMIWIEVLVIFLMIAGIVLASYRREITLWMLEHTEPYQALKSAVSIAIAEAEKKEHDVAYWREVAAMNAGILTETYAQRDALEKRIAELEMKPAPKIEPVRPPIRARNWSDVKRAVGQAYED